MMFDFSISRRRRLFGGALAVHGALRLARPAAGRGRGPGGGAQGLRGDGSGAGDRGTNNVKKRAKMEEFMVSTGFLVGFL